MTEIPPQDRPDGPEGPTAGSAPGAGPATDTVAPDADAPPPPGSGPAPAPPRRPELRRSTTDSVIGGVAGGVARTLDVDPVLTRIVFVIAGLTFPPFIIAYIAAWALLARDGDTGVRQYDSFAIREGGVGFWVGVALLVAVAFTMVDGPYLGRGFPLLPLVLVGIGVALWTREDNRRPRPYVPPGGSGPAPPNPGPTAPAPAGGTAPVASAPVAPAWPQQPADAGGVPPQGPPTARGGDWQPAPAPPPRPPRQRSPLGTITLALALIATGVVAAIDLAPGVPIDADPTHLAAVALLVLGLGQLVGAVWGRARWLTLVGLLLLPPVVVGAVAREVGVQLDIDGELALADGIGERDLTLIGDEDLPDDTKLLAGSIRLDLEDWTPDGADLAGLGDSDVDLDIDIGAGEVVLTTPTDVAWRLVAEVGVGNIVVRDQGGVTDRRTTEDLGTGVSLVRTGGPVGGPVLDIIVDVRLGEVDVRIPEPASTDQELS